MRVGFGYVCFWKGLRCWDDFGWIGLFLDWFGFGPIWSGWVCFLDGFCAFGWILSWMSFVGLGWVWMV